MTITVSYVLDQLYLTRGPVEGFVRPSKLFVIVYV